MTTLEHRDFREKNGFPDIVVPKELTLNHALGGEMYGSERDKADCDKGDVEVSMYLHRPGLTWNILVHEKGHGGCCLLDKLTECKTAKEAVIELSKECKKIFKKNIKLELETLP